jgi:hypothetical protein
VKSWIGREGRTWEQWEVDSKRKKRQK